MRIGFIGAGNMASAIIRGAIKSGNFSADDIFVYDINEDKVDLLANELKIISKSSLNDLINCVDAVILAVKPNVFESLLPQISEVLEKNNSLIISIAAGKSIAFISNLITYNAPIIRIMPNINATVFEAMCAYCANEYVSNEHITFVEKLCSSFGKVITIPEDKFSIYSAIAGCAPAFSYMFVDSLARAGVKNGLTKEQALKIAAQTVLGSAKKILESDEHPWELVDKVCSPGGTTIEGVCSLQDNGFESVIEKAVEASYNKDKKL